MYKLNDTALLILKKNKKTLLFQKDKFDWLPPNGARNQQPHTLTIKQIANSNRMDHIDEGNNGRLYTSKSGVVKVQKRKSVGHNVMTQKKIHILTEKLIASLQLKILRVPHVYQENTSQYEMEVVNTEKILYLGDRSHSADISDELYEEIAQEFTSLWIALFSNGYAAWDIELFLQPNGNVMLLDFDKYGIVSTRGTTIRMPHLKQSHQTYPDFFQNSCFSQDFTSRLRSQGFVIPSCLAKV